MIQLLADIRPDERRATYGAFATLFGVLAGHTLLETARDALFLASIPASRLPWMYLGIAFVSLAIFGLEQRRRPTGSTRAFATWLVVSAGVTGAFWFLTSVRSAWVLYALYGWTGVFATLIVVRFWTLIGDLFTVGQAKRLFAFIGAGSVLGAIGGSLAARTLTWMGDVRLLLVAAATALLLTALAVVFVLPRAAGSEADRGRAGGGSSSVGFPLAAALRTVWDRSYLRRVAGIVLISTVTFTLVDYLFKSTVAEVVSPEDLGGFFASTYVVLNVLSLGTQVFLVGWMVRTAGIDRVLSVLPMAFVLGAVGLLAVGGLLAALLLKLFDGALRHSLHRTAVEVLYVPLTGDVRARVKGVIDVVGQRGGQAAASLGILLVVAIGAERWILGGAVIALSAAWIYLSKSLQRFYLDLFRQTLNEAAVQTRFDFPQLDLASLESLMAALNSPNDAEVIAALDLLAEQGRVRLIPALILYHPSPEVVIHALEVFAAGGRDDFLPILDRLLESEDPELRTAALRASAWFAPRTHLFDRFAADPSPMVRAAALVGQVSFQGSQDALASLEGLAEAGRPEARRALVRAIRYSPSPAFEGVLISLAQFGDAELRLEVAKTMREILSTRFIPSLQSMLAVRETRTEARRTLVAIGPDALRELGKALSTEWLDPNVRRHLPRTISQFRSQKAVDILVPHLLEDSDGIVRYKVLRALGRLKSDQPELQLDEDVVFRAAERTLRGTFRVLQSKINLDAGVRQDPKRATAVQDLIRSLLVHKHALALERLFRLLGLLHPGEDLRSIYRGLRSSRPAVRASSRELLEHVLEPPLRDPVLRLVDEIPDEARIRGVEPYHTFRRQAYADVLRDLLETGGMGTRCLVAYHVAELRLHGLRKVLEELPSDPEGFVAQSVDRALEALSRPESQREGVVR